MHGVSSTYQGLIFGTAFASLAASACASAGMMGADRLAAAAESSSCANPVIMKHAASDENQDILAQERLARVLGMGYEIADLENAKRLSDERYAKISQPACGQPDMYRYDVVGNSSDEAAQTLYVRHMSAEAIKADPNVKCAPTYSQVYQPPLKLGGSGRVIQVRDGENCNKNTMYNTKKTTRKPYIKNSLDVNRNDFALSQASCISPSSLKVEFKKPRNILSKSVLMSIKNVNQYHSMIIPKNLDNGAWTYEYQFLLKTVHPQNINKQRSENSLWQTLEVGKKHIYEINLPKVIEENLSASSIWLGLSGSKSDYPETYNSVDTYYLTLDDHCNGLEFLIETTTN